MALDDLFTRKVRAVGVTGYFACAVIAPVPINAFGGFIHRQIVQVC